MGSREGETWGSWWRETAVYRWCESMAAYVYEYAAAAFIFAALPFQLLAQVRAGTIDPSLDGAYASIERLGDLVVAEALLLKQKNGVALIFG